MKFLKNYQNGWKGKFCFHEFYALGETKGGSLLQYKKCFRQIENRFYE